MQKEQLGLFDTEIDNGKRPLAHRARPEDFTQFYGQEHIFKQNPELREGLGQSIILYGPPGSGKTTLAHLLAKVSDGELYTFNAVLGGIQELKKLIQGALEVKKICGTQAIFFIDEIHRFNKAQQDALLPYVEAGEFILIGATTENPKVSVNRALLSRMRVIGLRKIASEGLEQILTNVRKRFELQVNDEVIQLIANNSSGDARCALSFLQLVHDKGLKSVEEVKQSLLENSRHYDKNGNRHYDVISAFIKSMRGSDPNAALLWLAVMLDGGEDPVFIARRLVIFASEDVGNSDPAALTLAVSTLQAVQNIGMPEARISLAQATTYLASTTKSNAAYMGINQAMAYVKDTDTIEVPAHLRNHKPGYKYPHDYPGHYVPQKYTNEDLPNFYDPTDQGIEIRLRDRLKKLSLTTHSSPS